jgi:hypothetical protein
MDKVLFLLFFLSLPLIVLGRVLLAMWSAHVVRVKREAIEKQFQALVPCMAGGAAEGQPSIEVLKQEEETNARSPTLRITRIVKNAQGEYFRFSGGDTDDPVLMRLSEIEARRALLLDPEDPARELGAL